MDYCIYFSRIIETENGKSANNDGWPITPVKETLKDILH